MSKARTLADYVAGGSTAAEFDVLDGLTSTTAELNILDGVTSTAAELNILDGVTSTAAEINLLDGVTSTTAELNHVDGVTSNVQTQLNAKAPLASPTFTGTTTVSGDLVPSTPLSHRNMIINGGMQVWQRATAATAISDGVSTADRWYAYRNCGAMTSEQEPLTLADKTTTGQANSFQIKCTTADGMGSGEQAYISQLIEAQNCQHLGYGTTSAKNLILSFWVKSNLTGTYCITVAKSDSTTAFLPIEYTISQANTWEKKEISISPTAGGNTLITGSSGVIDNNNGIGLDIKFWLAAGSNKNGTNNTWHASAQNTSNQVNFMSSTSNVFEITGVQLELGSNATPFEHRSYGDELIRCQRYYCQEIKPQYGVFAVGRVFNSKTPQFGYQFSTPMRVLPSVAAVASGCGAWYSSGSFTALSTPAYYQDDTSRTDVSTASLVFAANSSLTDNDPITLSSAAAGSGLAFSSEL